MSRGDRPARGWAPRGAVVFAVFALVALAGPAVVAAWSVMQDLSTTGEKFDGLGTAIGALGLVLCVIVAAPLASFLRRGGKATFWTGTVVWVVFVLFLLNLGFSTLLTGAAAWVFLAAAVIAAVVAGVRARPVVG
ncbi:hypothetical protein [Ornithinimicrobium avium]|uniref:Uncharacterized protein n=1 Tax=Ornithinimicrobium avium TaxID=2283195 RepID=A0A345NPL3_9MICO|nr:hypothetical protein [Ornithinimicrobium avium]AXH96971.1 hypothetical protein DV701_13345 [Ornithinimicrobium avium]